MTIAARPELMTFDQFVHWSAAQHSGRFELVNGKVIKMSPERNGHVDAKMEAWLALKNAVAAAGLPLHASGDGVAVVIDEHTAREPDASIQTLPVDPDSLKANEPVVVLEVVSPSSERSDTGAKLAEYFTVPSILHYLIVDTDGRNVIRHSRDAKGSITTTVFQSGEIKLDPPGLVVNVEALLPRTSGGEVDR